LLLPSCFCCITAAVSLCFRVSSPAL